MKNSGCFHLTFVSVVCFVAVSACGGRSQRTSTKSRGDAGFRPPDSGTIDTGTVFLKDTGIFYPDATTVAWDSGVHADATFFPHDSGVHNDASTTMGLEGAPCGVGQTCSDPALTCVDFSESSTPEQDRVRVCLRGCAVDGDCVTSSAGALCRPVLFDQMACVANDVIEGLNISPSRSRGGSLSGCQPGLFAMPWYVGSLLFDLADDELSCGRPCDPSAPSCGVTYPYCNPNIFTQGTETGVCMLRKAEPGDVCSQHSVVGMCDTALTPAGNSPSTACVGIPNANQNAVPPAIVDPNDPSPLPTNGICVAFCDPTPGTPGNNDPDCSHADDPGTGPAVCKQGDSTDPEFGICSNECDQFPDRCGRAGAFGRGTACTIPLAFDQTVDPFTICKSVTDPVITEWDFVATPSVNCLAVAGGESRCPANTFCIDGGTGLGVCVRGCASQMTPDGCEVSTVQTSTCADDIIGDPADGFGLCMP